MFMKFSAILSVIAFLASESTLTSAETSLQGVPCSFAEILGCVGEKLTAEAKTARRAAKKVKRAAKKATALASVDKKKIVEKQHLRADADSRCPIHVTDIYSNAVTTIGFCSLFTPCYDLGGGTYITFQPYSLANGPIKNPTDLENGLIPTCAALAPGPNSNCPDNRPFLDVGNFGYVNQEATCEDMTEDYGTPYIVDFTPLINDVQNSPQAYEFEVACFPGVGLTPTFYSERIRNENDAKIAELRLSVDITDPVCQQIVKACPGPSVFPPPGGILPPPGKYVPPAGQQ